MNTPSRQPLPRLRSNIAALGVVQIGNYVIPLITLPYLARVLGAGCSTDRRWSQAPAGREQTDP